MLTFGAAMNLLLTVCALILTVGVLRTAFKIFRRWNVSDEEERHELEKGFYLTFSVVIVVLGIRLFLVPLYFWNMQSFVPLVPGAMCLWGVFNALPNATWPSLFLKIILPGAYLSWILLARVNSTCKKNPLIRNLMILFLVLTPLLLVDFGTELYVLSQLSPVEVSCCSSAIDVGTRLVPGVVGGLSGQAFLLVILLPYSLLFVVSLFLSSKYRAARLNALIISPPIAILLIITITETLDALVAKTSVPSLPLLPFLPTSPLTGIYGAFLVCINSALAYFNNQSI